MTNTDELSWLPLLEAGMRLGKSTDAVRSMIRRDKLATRKGNDGRLLIGVPPVEGQAGDGLATVIDPSGDGHTTAELRLTLEELREELFEARVALARAEEKRDAAERNAKDAQETAQRIAEAQVAAAKADAAARDHLITELKTLLAVAQRPWWRRLIG
jgi:hypothetical protein